MELNCHCCYSLLQRKKKREIKKLKSPEPFTLKTNFDILECFPDTYLTKNIFFLACQEKAILYVVNLNSFSRDSEDNLALETFLSKISSHCQKFNIKS